MCSTHFNRMKVLILKFMVEYITLEEVLLLCVLTTLQAGISEDIKLLPLPYESADFVWQLHRTWY